MDPLIGGQLGNYRLEQVVGRGGMATVYLGRDVRLERPVAVKVIDERYRADPGYAQRFVREARAIASLRHPHIVLVYQAGEENGLYYYAMEYVRGQDLRRQMKALRDLNQLLPFDEILRIGRAVAGALDYAHQRGVIHRDVKPSNVLLSTEGRILLTDFGLALQSDEGTRGEVFGSPQYIAPEQARSSAQAVAQSDLYALGVMLYEMLVGELPFQDPNPAVLAYQHISQPPPAPRSLNPDLSPAVEAVLLRALRKNPSERFSSGQELLERLENALQGGGSAADTLAGTTMVGGPGNFPATIPPEAPKSSNDWESTIGAPAGANPPAGRTGGPAGGSGGAAAPPPYDPYATAAMPGPPTQAQPAYPKPGQPPRAYPGPGQPPQVYPSSNVRQGAAPSQPVQPRYNPPPPPPVYPPSASRRRGRGVPGWALGCLLLISLCGLAGFSLYRFVAGGGLSLPSINLPRPATPTQPGQTTTIAPTETSSPTDTPADTSTPEPSQTPSPSPTTTETPTQTAAPSETPPPTSTTAIGARLVLEIRTGQSLLLINEGPFAIWLKDLKLRSSSEELGGQEWEAEELSPGECVAVWQDRNPNQPIPQVDCDLVGVPLERSGDRQAWREPFEVLYRNELLGLCDPQGNMCEIDVPTP